MSTLKTVISKYRSKFASALTILLCLLALTLSLYTTNSGALSANAESYFTNDKTWNENIDYSDWSQIDSKTLLYSVSIPSEEGDYYNNITSCGLTVSTTGGYDLEYYVQLVYNNSVVAESSWKNVLYKQYLSWDWAQHSYSDDVYIYYYVRRIDGDDLAKSSMYPASFNVYGFNETPLEIEQTTAIPQDWLVTSTAEIPVIVDTSTTVIEIPSDYQSIDTQTVDDYLTLPARVVSITTYALTIMGRLLSLKYITPMLCFGLLVALAGWLFH